MSDGSNAGNVEGIDAANVTAWFGEHVSGVTAPLTFELIAGGHSNLTFGVKDNAGRTVVLRRPPLGHVLESAHDMAREHRIISALVDSGVPVASTLGLCEDKSVNEAPFYVMDYVAGPVLHDVEVSKTIPESERQSLSLHVVDVLATLHNINPDDVGLGELGRKEAYLERQLKRWNKQWEASKTHEIPAMDESSKLLAEKMPEQVGATIVHGDYRLGNMIIGSGKILAVLDWELCTLGDPLADVGYLLNSWVLHGEADEDLAATAVSGFAAREVMTARYAEATGRDLTDINYYRAFSHWRLAAIGQGVYKRYLVGAMGENRDMDLDAYKESVSIRAEAALELLS
ncbi:MAG: phosphotransferase [Pseudomonadales bacterium]|nr:phosphotransferase [Pseudomonadales bacterium]